MLFHGRYWRISAAFVHLVFMTGHIFFESQGESIYTNPGSGINEMLPKNGIYSFENLSKEENNSNHHNKPLSMQMPIYLKMCCSAHYKIYRYSLLNKMIKKNKNITKNKVKITDSLSFR